MKKTLLAAIVLALTSLQVYSQCSPCLIPFVAASQAQGTGTSVTIPKPNGVSQNDVMIAAIHDGWCNSGNAVTGPVGWTLINFTCNTGTGCGNTNTTRQLHTFYKVVGSAEPLNYTFTGSTSQIYVGAIIAYSGVNTTTPINIASNNGAQDACNALVANSVTTTASCTRLIGVFFCSVNFGGNNIVPPNSMTERVDVGNTGNHPWGNENVEMADEMWSTTGATGTRTAALSGCSSTGWVTGAQLIALNCNATVGISDHSISNLVSVSPNPSSGIFNLEFRNLTAEKKAEVEIYNTLGEKMFTSVASQQFTSIDLTNLPKGIYFIKIGLPEGIVTKKIVLE